MDRFRYVEHLRRSDDIVLGSVRGVAEGGRCYLTRSVLDDGERPFWGYWEGRYPEIDGKFIWCPDAV